MAYLYAMRNDEASNVAPLFQIIPIFSFIFGYIFFGEILSTAQFIGAFFILGGSIAITLRYDGVRIIFRRNTFVLMLISSMLLAATGVLFKLAALDENFWVANFWENIGMSTFAIILLICAPIYRREFVAVLYQYPKMVVGLNAFNEILSIIGLLLINYAMLLVPVALVSVTASIQPLFVLMIGIGITIFFPSITEETITGHNLGRKIFAIATIIFGSYVINQ